MRYVAQRYGTWEWLDLELPLDTDGPEWALSSYGVMTATIAPELGLQKAEDGRPVLEEWGTLIHAEAGSGPSSRRWTGIVVRSELEGKTWEITVWEFPGYLDGTPIEKKVWGVRVDPADIFRQIWGDVQKRPQAWLGVSVKGTVPKKIGTESDDMVIKRKKQVEVAEKYDKAMSDQRKKLYDNQRKQADAASKVIDKKRKEVSKASSKYYKIPYKDKKKREAAKKVKDRLDKQLKDLNKEYDKLTKYHKTKLDKFDENVIKPAEGKLKSLRENLRHWEERAADDGGAYKFLPEDTPDAHDSVVKLAEDAGFEWTTSTRYTEGKPKLTVQIHFPRAGGVRDDLVFEQGVNVISELKLERDGVAYANAAVGLGAGEGKGKKAIRETMETTHKRLRRVAVVEDKKIKNSSAMLNKMRKELRKRTGELYVTEIEVVDHPLAPMFSWNVGDIIRVSGHVPHYGFINKLHRIVSWQMKGDYRALLKLELPPRR